MPLSFAKKCKTTDYFQMEDDIVRDHYFSQICLNVLENRIFCAEMNFETKVYYLI